MQFLPGFRGIQRVTSTCVLCHRDSHNESYVFCTSRVDRRARRRNLSDCSDGEVKRPRTDVDEDCRTARISGTTGLSWGIPSQRVTEELKHKTRLVFVDHELSAMSRMGNVNSKQGLASPNLVVAYVGKSRPQEVLESGRCATH